MCPASCYYDVSLLIFAKWYMWATIFSIPIFTFFYIKYQVEDKFSAADLITLLFCLLFAPLALAAVLLNIIWIYISDLEEVVLWRRKGSEEDEEEEDEDVHEKTSINPTNK